MQFPSFIFRVVNKSIFPILFSIFLFLRLFRVIVVIVVGVVVIHSL